MNELVKVQLRPYTAVERYWNLLEHPGFHQSAASSGIRGGVPRGAYIQM